MTRYRLLVTGGAGFIGSTFVRYVMRELADVHIVVLDKLTYAGHVENLGSAYEDPRLSFIQGDICDREAVDRAMQNCNWVVHFAAETHVDRSISEAERFIRTNVEGTRVLLEAARNSHITRFLHVSTDEVYGNAESPKGVSRPSLETDALKPRSPYAASKVGAECLAFSYWTTYELPVIVTRCSNNYGPYQYLEKQLPIFITRALAGRPLPIHGNGSNTRDWIHVTDHCSALVKILLAPIEQVVGEVFNIGSGQERSTLENARLVLKLLELPESHVVYVPDRPGNVYRHAIDTTKVRNLLHWRPERNFGRALAETIVWYREHEQWLSSIREQNEASTNMTPAVGSRTEFCLDHMLASPLSRS